LSNASLFVDDAEAYEKYQREPDNDQTEQNVSFFILVSLVHISTFDLVCSNSDNQPGKCKSEINAASDFHSHKKLLCATIITGMLCFAFCSK